MLFYVCYSKPNNICVAFLTALLIHSIYWLEFISEYYGNQILVIYNLTVLTNVIITVFKTYNRTVKLSSLGGLILSGLIYNVNVFGYMYGYNVNLFNLDYQKATKSLWLWFKNIGMLENL